MVVYIKYNFSEVFKRILQEQLEKLNVIYSSLGSTEVEIPNNISSEKMQQLSEGLNDYGGEIIENNKNIIVQKIKDAIVKMVYSEEPAPHKISDYITEKVNYKYGYLSNIFSEVTFTTINNFIAQQKTERAKQLMISTNFNLSEIAWKLNYSSSGHFSTQFKNVTGLTPTAFRRISEKSRKTQNTLQPTEIDE